MRPKPVALIALTAAATASHALAWQMMTPAMPSSGMAGPPPTRQSVDAGLAAEGQPVYAVIAHHVVHGEIKPGLPLMALVDERQPQFTCRIFQHNAEIRLACSDGVVAQLKMNASGCAQSSSSGEPASLCVGFTARSAARRLSAPAGETLGVEDGRLALKPAAG